MTTQVIRNQYNEIQIGNFCQFGVIKKTNTGGEGSPSAPISNVGADSNLTISVIKSSGFGSDSVYSYSIAKVYINGKYIATADFGNVDYQEAFDIIESEGIRIYEAYQRVWSVLNITNADIIVRIESVDDKAFTYIYEYEEHQTPSKYFKSIGTVDHFNNGEVLSLIHSIDVVLAPQ